MSDRTPIFAQHETWEDIVAELRAEVSGLRERIAELEADLIECQQIAYTNKPYCEETSYRKWIEYHNEKHICLLKEQAESSLAEHLASHLCLLKHGPEEKPEKIGVYLCKFWSRMLDRVGYGEVWWNGNQWHYAGGVKEWYSLPERSDG